MAASTITHRSKKVGGKYHHHIAIVETAAAAATETVIDVPNLGTIVKFHSVLVSGTASTVNPELGRAASWVDDKIDQVIADPGAAAFVNNTARTAYAAPGKKFYLRSQPNTGSDNVIHTQIMIISSWE